MKLFSLILISVVCCSLCSCLKNKYTLTVVTGLESSSKKPPEPGTTEAVYIKLTGSKGHFDWHRLNDETEHFKAGQSDNYIIPIEDIGTIQEIELLLHCTMKKGDIRWLLKGVFVYDDLRHLSQWYKCNYWFNSTQAFNATQKFRPSPIIVLGYKVIVETGDQKDAGTHGEVYITLLGSERESHTILLDHEVKSAFQRGQTDTFYITAREIGDVSKIRIELDSTADSQSPNWFLKAVSLVNDASKLEQWFPWNQWLTPTAEQKTISVEIPVSANKGNK